MSNQNKPLNNFQKKSTTIKGTFAENLIIEILQETYFVLKQQNAEPHPFDLMLQNKKNIIEFCIADVKCKPAMYTNLSTGICTKKYHQYKQLSADSNMPFKLYFVDPVFGEIWAGNIDDLYKSQNGYPYKTNNGNVIIFDPTLVSEHYELDVNTIQALRQSHGNYGTYTGKYPELIAQIDNIISQRPSDYKINTWKTGPSNTFNVINQMNIIKKQQDKIQKEKEAEIKWENYVKQNF